MVSNALVILLMSLNSESHVAEEYQYSKEY